MTLLSSPGQESFARWGELRSILVNFVESSQSSASPIGLPLAFVDLDALHRNCRRVTELAGSLPVRLATKSVRSVDIMRLVLREYPQFRGLMAWSPAEAAWLASLGFDDILIAYPSLDEKPLREALGHVREGRRIVFMVDHTSHVELLTKLAGTKPFDVCIDIDMSVALPGLHFGVRRSPLSSPEQALALAQQIKQNPHARIVGVMGYEAQVAGIQDTSRTSPNMARVTRLLKALTTSAAFRRRHDIVIRLKENGTALTLVNGGGSGSLAQSREDSSLTELTSGSALFCPHLFDGYKDLGCSPAAGFALQITRAPAPGIWTCNGGGLIASGSAGPDRLPLPWYPKGAKLLGHEGAGEVQTPLQIPGSAQVKLGDLVLFRHAKAGELCEHFPELLLISGTQVVGRAKTYRGEAQKF